MNGLKIAIPNKGRMSEDIFALLKQAGLNFSSKSESSQKSAYLSPWCNIT